MENRERILSLIGLCLRGRHLEVGEEPVEAVTRARDARLLLLASDAADNTARRVQHFAETGHCIWLKVPFTRQELGQATGRTAAAVAAVTDIGLAAAVVRRLAEEDPEAYAQPLERLELKAKRAAERQSEEARHQKNLRRGIKRSKGPAAEKKTADSRPPEKAGDAEKTSGPRKPASGGASRRGEAGRAPARRAGSFRSEASDAGNRPAGLKQSAGLRQPAGAKRAAAGKSFAGKASAGRTGAAHTGKGCGKTRGGGRTGAKPDPFPHSRPVKKGKGSFRKKEV